MGLTMKAGATFLKSPTLLDDYLPAKVCRPPLPVELTPRWRLTHVGAEALSDAELVTLFLGGAGSETATDLLCEIGGLRGLRRATLHELRTLPGVGAARAAALVAAVELGRRLSSIRNSDLPKISSPEDVDTLMRPRLAHLDRENFVRAPARHQEPPPCLAHCLHWYPDSFHGPPPGGLQARRQGFSGERDTGTQPSLRRGKARAPRTTR